MSRRMLLVVALLALLVVGIGANAWVDSLARRGAAPPALTLAPGQTPLPTPAPTLTPDELALVFERPAARQTSYGPVELRIVPIDNIVLQSGRVVASDPFFTDAEPFVDALDPGMYPVQLVLATFDDGDERVAAARLGTAAVGVVNWREARTPSNATLTESPGMIFGYGVDSGSGSFYSPEAGAAATADHAYGDRLLSALGLHEQPSWNWASVVTDPSSGANVVAFASGFGDGGYATYVGRDRGGRVVAFLTDFGVLDRP